MAMIKSKFGDRATIEYVQCDITDRDQVEKLFKHVEIIIVKTNGVYPEQNGQTISIKYGHALVRWVYGWVSTLV